MYSANKEERNSKCTGHEKSSYESNSDEVHFLLINTQILTYKDTHCLTTKENIILQKGNSFSSQSEM